MNKETKLKLIWNAVTTLFDVLNPPAKVTQSRLVKKRSIVVKASSSVKPTKTIKSLSDQPSTSIVEHKCDTPQKKRLKRKVKALKTKLWRKCKQRRLSYKDEVNSLIVQLKYQLPQETVQFIERQVLLQRSAKVGWRYATADKMMALSIFYQSQKAY